MATVHWINGGGGNWSNLADWSGNPAGNDDVIDAAGTYTVFVDGVDLANSLATIATVTVRINYGDSLTLAAGTGTGANSGTIDITNNSELAIAGTFDNAGRINIQGYNTATMLLVNAPVVTLNGGGSIVLTDAGTASQIVGAAATDELVNVNNTISGAGLIGNGALELDNQAAGVIDATGGNRLYVSLSGASSNEGLIEATGGNGLQLSSSGTLTNTGTILASGTNVYLDGITIVGGTLQSIGNNLQIEYANTDTLQNVTLAASSVLQIDNNAFLDAVGTLTNKGTLVVDGYNTTTQLVVNSSTLTLTGAGQVQLVDSGGGSQIVGAVATDKLVNVNNLIQGAGLIGNGTLTLDNQAAGTIDATGGNRLVIQLAGALTNEGKLEATGGNGLQITGGTTITNTGTILASGANVFLDSVSVVGGALQTAGTGLYIEGGSISTKLQNTTLTTGSYFQIDNTSSLDAVGTLTNKGTVVVQGYNSTTQFVVDSATMTLTGAGTVQLLDSGTNTQIVGAAAADKLVNVNNTIFGAGLIGNASMSLDNQLAGTIDATGGNRLILNTAGGTFTNEGLLEATGGNGLQISGGTTLTNTGTILGSGAYVYLDDMTLNGGTIKTVGAEAQIEYGNTTVMTNVTLVAGGTLRIDNNAVLDATGTLTNKAAVIVNGYNTATELVVDASTLTLTGAGTLTLVDSGTGSIVTGAAAADKLVNVNNTISGAGLIGDASMSLDNQAAGIIDATGGNRLILDTSGGNFTNEGLIEATGGGLQISGTTNVVNTGSIVANGANVYLDGAATITGGTLLTPLGEVQVEGANVGTLSGVTIGLNAVFQIDNNASLDLVGTLTNSGTVIIDGFNAATALVVASPTVTLVGGAVQLVDAGSASQITGASTADLLVNVSSVISGAGLVGNGTVNIDNRVGGLIEATSGGSALVIDTAYVVNTTTLHETFTNEGVLASINPGNGGVGGLTIANAIINNTGNGDSGQIQALGLNTHVDLQAGTVIQGGTLETNSNGDGVFTVDYGNSATLDGTAAAITLNGSLNIANNAALVLLASLTNTGDIAIQGYNAATQLLAGGASATLTGGGSVSLYDAGSASQIGATAAGNTLVNVNNTISGGGTIGVGGLAFDNRAAGTIDSTNNSRLVLATAGESFTNEGLIEATSGVGLQLGAGTVITNTGTLLAGGATFYLDSGAVTGGTLTATTSQFDIEYGNTGTLSGVTLTSGGVFNIANNGFLDILGTITNAGTLQITGYNTATQLVVAAASATLTGGGTVELVDAGGQSQIAATTAGDELVNVNNVIYGAGIIGNGAAIDNQASGTIDATFSDRLYLNSAGQAFSNEGLIEATGGGGLQISGGTTITNTGTILASGANVYVDGGEIAGGSLVAASGSEFDIEYGNTGTLSGGTITAGSVFNVANNGVLALLGDVTNDGAILVSTYNTTTDILVSAATATLSGNGTVQLANNGGSVITGAAAADKLVNAGNTIEGGGQLGAGSMQLDNQAAGVIDGNVSQTLIIDTGLGALTNEGTIEATGGGGVVIQNATLTNTGLIEATDSSPVTIAASVKVTNLNGTTLTNGGWGAVVTTAGDTATLAVASGPVVTDAATIILSGVGSSVTFGGTAVETSLTTIAAGGALDVLGARGYTTTNRLTDNGAILLQGGTFATGGAITVGGTGTIAGDGTFTNAVNGSGLLDARGGGTLSIATGVTGSFALEADAGTVLQVNEAAIVTDSGSITLNGAGSDIKFGAHAPLTTIETSLTTIATTGTFSVIGGRSYSTTNALTDSGQVVFAGGTFTAGSFTITSTGTLSGSGIFAPSVANSGAVVAQGGVLDLAAGASGTGTFSSAAGATLEFGATSTVGAVTANGTVELVGGTLSPTSLTVAAGGDLYGYGTIAGVTVGNSGTVEAKGGDLLLTHGVTGTGNLQSDTGGTLELATSSSAGTVTSSGVIKLDNITLTASAVTINAGGTIVGTGTISQAITNSGQLEASAGMLTVTGKVTGTGRLVVDPSGTLDLAAVPSITALTGSATLNGAGSVLEAGTGAAIKPIESTLTTIGAGVTLAILGGRNFVAAKAVSSSGTVQLGGGTYSGPTLTLGAAGRVLGYGTMASAMAGAGTIESLGGLLTLSGGATGTAVLLAEAGSTLDLTANVTDKGEGVFGTLELGGVTVTSSELEVEKGGRVIGGGTITGKVLDTGTIEATGHLKLSGAVSAAGTLQIDSGATLELGSSIASTDVVVFGASPATLQLDAPGGVAATLGGWATGDTISLNGTVISGISYSTSTKTLTVTGASGTIAKLKFAGTYTQANFSLADNNTEIVDPAPAAVTAQAVTAAKPSFVGPVATPDAIAYAWGAGNDATLAAPPAPQLAAWSAGSTQTPTLGGTGFLYTPDPSPMLVAQHGI
jgi:hypothetical protein